MNSGLWIQLTVVKKTKSICKTVYQNYPTKVNVLEESSREQLVGHAGVLRLCILAVEGIRCFYGLALTVEGKFSKD